MMCALVGMQKRRKRKQEEENDMENRMKGETSRKGYLPESPTGAEYVVPPVSLDEGPESGESNGKRDSELVRSVFLCFFACVRGEMAAARPSITV